MRTPSYPWPALNCLYVEVLLTALHCLLLHSPRVELLLRYTVSLHTIRHSTSAQHLNAMMTGPVKGWRCVGNAGKISGRDIWAGSVKPNSNSATLVAEKYYTSGAASGHSHLHLHSHREKCGRAKGRPGGWGGGGRAHSLKAGQNHSEPLPISQP